MRENQRPQHERHNGTSSDRAVDETTETDETETDSKRTCSECEGDVITDESTGELLCDSCGLVIDDQVIDHGPEWRAYNASERNQRSRTGAPLTELRHDRGLSSDIDWRNQDASGRQLSSEKRKQMQRLRKRDYRAKHDSTGSNLSYANGEIKRMGSALGVPKDIQETAASLYRESHKKELVPGRSIEGMATASLYIALRIHNEPRSLDELTKVSRINRKPLQRAFRYICRELEIPLEPTSPSKYIPRFATKLTTGTVDDIPQKIIQQAERLSQNISDTHHVSGNDPTVLAASALYAAALREGTLLTQADVRDASGVTEVSIRNNYGMFLVLDDETAITQDDVESATTPMELAESLNDSPSYIDTAEQTTDTESTTETSTQTPEIKNTNEDPMTQTDSDTDADTDAIKDESEQNNPNPVQSDSETTQEPTTNGDEDKNYSCPECPCVFGTYRGLQIHVGHTHDDVTLSEKETYAVSPETHPVVTSNDNRNTEGTVSLFTVNDVRTSPLTLSESEHATEKVANLFNTYDHDFHPATELLTKTVLASAGTNLGDCSYRQYNTATAAAIYAVTQTIDEITETTYTQEDISQITDVSKNQISKVYPDYIEALNQLLR